MTRVIPPLLIGASTGAVDVGSHLLENHHVGIGSAMTIACFVGAACFWIDKQFRKRDEIRAARDEALADRLARLEQKIDDLDEFKKRKHHET